MDEMKLTSVKILESLYNKFKMVIVNNKMSLQKITNRSVYLYLNDEEFRAKINESNHLVISSSKI